MFCFFRLLFSLFSAVLLLFIDCCSAVVFGESVSSAVWRTYICFVLTQLQEVLVDQKPRCFVCFCSLHDFRVFGAAGPFLFHLSLTYVASFVRVSVVVSAVARLS